MQRSLLITFIVIALFLGGIIALSSRAHAPSVTSNAPTVAATIAPIADIAQSIAGPSFTVVTIVPPGATPHAYEPTPADIKRLSDASTVFAIGAGLDSWVEEVTAAIPGLAIEYVDEGITLQPLEFGDADNPASGPGSPDPHYWLSTENASIIAEHVAATLSGQFPDRAAIFQQNLAAFRSSLSVLHGQIEAVLAPLTDRKLVLFHESFQYFAREFGLDIVGVFEPTPGAEPSPRYLKELSDTAKAEGVRTVFSEPQFSTATMTPFIADLGLSLGILDPEGGVAGRSTYADLLRFNATNIAHGLAD